MWNHRFNERRRVDIWQLTFAMETFPHGAKICEMLALYGDHAIYIALCCFSYKGPASTQPFDWTMSGDYGQLITFWRRCES